MAAGRRQAAALHYRTMLLALMPALGENPSPPAAALVGTVLGIFAQWTTSAQPQSPDSSGTRWTITPCCCSAHCQVPVEARAWVDGAAAYYTVFQEGALADLRLSNTVADPLRRWS